MKDIYKNAVFYYIAAPIVVALWPLLLWTVYSPGAADRWENEKIQYEKAQKIIAEILSIDPERIKFADLSAGATEFDYANAVEKTATLCGIPSTKYKLSSGIIITSGKQKSQSAMVGLNEVDIVKFAKFLSTIQLRWSNLQCSAVKLKKKTGLPDIWDVDIDFKYYY